MLAAQTMTIDPNMIPPATVDTRRGKAINKNPKRNMCQWVQRPRYNPDNQNMEGFLEIEGDVYQVVEINFNDDTGAGCRLWRLNNGKNEWQVTMDRQGDLACDCPDAVFGKRECGCKHARAIVAAYEYLETMRRIENAIETELANDDAYGPESPF